MRYLLLEIETGDRDANQRLVATRARAAERS
jgi:hypothetical protein